MIMIKRGLIVILVLFLLSNFVYAAEYVDSNLSINKFGPNSNLKGYLTFNFTEIKPFDTALVVHIGNVVRNLRIIEILNKSGLLTSSNFHLFEARYTNSSLPMNEVTVTLDNNMYSKVEVGIDLRSEGTVEEIRNVSFNVGPSAGSSLNDVSIYLGEKRIYRYRKDIKNGWAPLDRSYISSSQSDAEVTGGSIFCQLVNVNDSGEYMINVSLKKFSSNSPQAKVNLTLISSDLPINTNPDCSNPETPCCELPNLNTITTTFANYACSLRKNIPDTRQEYLCMYTNSSDTETYYALGSNSASNGKGYLNGNAIPRNFFIFGEYATYDRKLATTVQANLSVDDFNEYRTARGGTLLIPLNITSMTGSGGVVLNGLNFKYTSHSLQSTLRQFTKITSSPKSFNYTGTISLDLNKYQELTTPQSTGSYKYYVDFASQRSRDVDFEVVEASKAFIIVSNLNPSKNEIVTFDANSSTPVSGRNITNYLWNFGDGTNASGILVNHAFNDTKNYDVRLEVIDSSGISGTDTVVIQVQNTTTSTDAINSSLNAIAAFLGTVQSSPQQVKDTVKLIGLEQSLMSLQSNLTLIKLNYDTLMGNTSINESIKSARGALLIQQASTFTGKIPLSIKVDSSTFSGKITGLNQVTTCCEFTTEILKTKLLAAQKEVKVDAEARIVKLTYPGKTENFMLIKKDITGSGAKVYEFVPAGITIEKANVFVGGEPSPTGNVYAFKPTNQIIYKINEVDLSKALQTRTAVLPADLNSVVVVTGTPKEEPIEIEIKTECGNKVCENDETESSCPKDCKESSTTNFVIILIGALILISCIIYFGLFFNGGLFKGDKPIIRNVQQTNQLFKTQQDHDAVKSFIQSSLNKGLGEDKIHVVLKSKGWKDEQITTVLKEIKMKK